MMPSEFAQCVKFHAIEVGKSFPRDGFSFARQARQVRSDKYRAERHGRLVGTVWRAARAKGATNSALRRRDLSDCRENFVSGSTCCASAIENCGPLFAQPTGREIQLTALPLIFDLFTSGIGDSLPFLSVNASRCPAAVDADGVSNLA